MDIAFFKTQHQATDGRIRTIAATLSDPRDTMKISTSRSSRINETKIDMQNHQRQSLLDAEVDEWSQRPYSKLLDELSDVAAYQRDGKEGFHQFEVQMVEQEPDYVHVIVSIDDGSSLRSVSPLSRSFIVHRDGHIEK